MHILQMGRSDMHTSNRNYTVKTKTGNLQIRVSAIKKKLMKLKYINLYNI